MHSLDWYWLTFVVPLGWLPAARFASLGPPRWWVTLDVFVAVVVWLASYRAAPSSLFAIADDGEWM